jgi:putative ABC transport system ATP-binding protein
MKRSSTATPALLLVGAEVTLGEATILPPVDLRLERGEVLALMGPSGSGKTTLLDCVVGLRTPTAGSVEVLGAGYGSMSSRERARLRRRSIGIIEQNPRLLPELDVAENVALVLVFDGVPRRRALALAREALTVVGLDGAGALRPENLSGGEAQRAALARALLSDRIELLVADEPTAALDEDNVRLMTELIVGTARDRDISVLLATHDTTVAERCDRIQRMRQADDRSRASWA